MKIIIDKDLQELSEILNRDETLKVECLAPKDINNKNIKSAEALFLRSITKINNKLLENTKVKFIASLTSGEDHINHETLKNLDIFLSSGQGGNTLAVVEYVLSTLSILLIGKKITPFETKIGIIGFGRIGKKLKEILDAIGFPNIVYDPYISECSGTLKDVLECDVITLHCSYSKQGKFPSHHLLTDQHLNKLSKKKFLINCSRGEVLTEDYFELKNNNFIFDVWPKENEPNFENYSKPMIATPHIAGKTIGAENNFSFNALKDFNNFFDLNLIYSSTQRIKEVFVGKSLEEEINFFGLPASLILKVYDVREDDLIFKKYFDNENINEDFQDLRISLKRLGITNHKITGNVSNKSKSLMNLMGFRL